MTKIVTNFKATQAKTLKIVIAKSLITNAHAMIIISHIRRLPYRGYITLKLCFTYKVTQIGKRYYFSWGEERLPELAPFWRSQWGLKALSYHPASPFAATFLATNLLVIIMFKTIFIFSDEILYLYEELIKNDFI